MALVLQSEIKIGNAKFGAVNDCQISKSIHSITQSCVIKLPLSAVVKNTAGVSTPVQVADYIKKGDPVTVTLWYDRYQRREEFTGYVKVINRKQPLEIECENALYELRGKTFKKSFKSVSLKELLQFITQGTNIRLHPTVDSQQYTLQITNFQIPDKDGVWVLQELKDKYMQTVYFTDSNELYVGLAYTNTKGSVKYSLEKNVIGTNDLKWQEKDDVKIRVRCICFAKDGSKTEAEFGDKDGEVRTIHLYDVTDKAQLEKLAQAEADKYRYSGYRGQFDTFLIPYCEPAMIASVSNNKYPERSGDYFISGVKVSFGMSGARRKVEIDFKVTK